ncbi:MAG TPA: hypothetical protein VJV23_06690, partial [Candidatus Polarisedimenticolia bacterium]|nr:hypothetical protein [Candidatus Polarisedimenticolia bacterium]
VRSLAVLAGVGVAALWLRSPADPPSPHDAGSVAAGQGPRVPLFVDPALVRPTPRFRYTFDPPEALAALRRQERLDLVVAEAADELERCVALMRWARRQWEPGVPGRHHPLDARSILGAVRADPGSAGGPEYACVLAQALQSFGVPARYVSLAGHDVIEARLPDQGRWVCFDPLYATWYKDESDAPLSVLEIHRRVTTGRPVLPADDHRFSDLAGHLRAFRSFSVWLKNDHVSSPVNVTDLDRYKLHYAGTPIVPLAYPPGRLATDEPADLYPG